MVTAIVPPDDCDGTRFRHAGRYLIAASPAPLRYPAPAAA